MVILGAFWSILGASGGHWATFGGVWGQKKAIYPQDILALFDFKGKVAQMDQNRVPTWSQNGQQIDQKTDKHLDVFFERFVGGFLPNLMTKWSQVRTNIGAKTDINLKTPKSAKHYKKPMKFQ